MNNGTRLYIWRDSEGSHTMWRHPLDGLSAGVNLMDCTDMNDDEFAEAVRNIYEREPQRASKCEAYEVGEGGHYLCEKCGGPVNPFDCMEAQGIYEDGRQVR